MSREPAAWFADAGIGVYVSWGPYSVPDASRANGVVADGAEFVQPGSEEWFRNSPEPSWYFNGLRQPDSRVRAYHRSTYGMHSGYGALARRFAEELEAWDPAEWVDLFKESGARYLVMPAKDLDGYQMWPGEGELHAPRDLLADVARETKKRGLRFGFSYSAGIDWTLQTQPVTSLAGFASPADGKLAANAFRDRVAADLTERIAALSPDLVHNPSPWREPVAKLLDRDDTLARIVWTGDWSGRGRDPDARTLRSAFASGAPVTQSLRTPRADSTGHGLPPQVPTVRYGMPASAPGFAWQYLYPLASSPAGDAETSLVHVLAAVASLGGNLLLGVNPRPNGQIPMEEREQLAALARWLRLNGEAIYQTRSWQMTDSETPDGVAVRYTARRDAVYAVVLGRPASLAVELAGFDPRKVPQPPEVDVRDFRLIATILDADREVAWRRSERGVEVDIPGSFVPADAMVIRFRWQL